LPRRAVLLGAAASLAAGRTPARASPLPTVRLGILPFGTVQWIATIISRHGLDEQHGFRLQTAQLANTEAAKVALMGQAVDIAVSDWPFVATQRSHGGHLTFVANSSTLGGVMVPAGSRISTLSDLRGVRLGVAGGAQDKSWLIVRAAARKVGIDLTRQATLSYGAPPLLGALLQAGKLDALLTFWNFAARLQAGGSREAIPVDECARDIGLPSSPVLLGWVFDEAWAAANPAAIGGFLAAARAAEDRLAQNPADWALIRPLMDAPSDALFANLRGRFLGGLSHPDSAAMQTQAATLISLLAADDINAGIPSLPPGVFWRGANAG
jgi:NitT/TauT family transport system substrate-binding protein